MPSHSPRWPVVGWRGPGSCGLVAVVMLATTAMLAPVRSAGADPLAVVVQVKGSVKVTPTKSSAAQKVGLGRTLERGDRVAVGPGGSATLFFSDGNVIELGEKSTVTIGGRLGSGAGAAAGAAAAGAPKNGVPAEVFAKVSRFVASDSRSSGMMALAPMRGAGDQTQPMLLAPRRTSVRSGRPAFSWRPVEGATRYRLIVTGDQGEVWNREIAGTSLEYPADASPLSAGGEYLWEVQAMSDAGPLRKDESTFNVLAGDDATRVSADLAGIDKATGESSTAAAVYLAGSYLMGRGLYGEAAAKFEALCKITPDAPGPHEALGNVYRTVGLTNLAAAEFQRALELSRSQ